MTPMLFSAVLEAAALLLFAAGAAEFALLLKGCLTIRRMSRGSFHANTPTLLKSPAVPAISVLALAPDSSPEMRAYARRLLDLHFPNCEVILVLDGGSPADLELWRSDFHLGLSPLSPAAPAGNGVRAIYESRDPLRLVVLDKEKGGEADALNTALDTASSGIVALVDARAVVTADALLRLVTPLLEDPEGTAAVCAITPVPAAGNLVQRFASLELLRAWLARGAAFANWNIPLPMGGSGVLIRRDAIRAAGGFRAGILDLLLRLPAGQRVVFIPEPVSYPPIPSTMAELRRWQGQDQKAIASVPSGRRHWTVRALIAGRFLRPLLETIALVGAVAGLVLGLAPWPLIVLLVLATAVTGALVSMAAVVLRELTTREGSDPAELRALFFAAIPENLGYRQVRNLWLVAGFRKQKTRENGVRPLSRGVPAG